MSCSQFKGRLCCYRKSRPCLNVEKTATYRIYYKKVIMRPCPSFGNVSWIIMSSCTDVKDVVSEMCYAMGNSKSPWKHNLIKKFGIISQSNKKNKTKELSRSVTVCHSCPKIVMMRRTVMIEMHCARRTVVSWISGPQNYWKNRWTGNTENRVHSRVPEVTVRAHGCNLQSPSATKVIYMTHYM